MLIKEQKLEFEERDNVLIETFHERLAQIQAINKTNNFTEDMLSRMWDEYESAKAKYIIFMIVGGALANFIYYFYLKPGTKDTYKLISRAYKALARNIAPLKPHLDNVSVPENRGRFLELDKRIKQISTGLEKGFFKMVFGEIGKVIQPGTSLNTGFRVARVLKIISTTAFGLHYFFFRGDESPEDLDPTTVGKININVIEEDNTLNPVEEFIYMGWEYIKIFTMLEFLWSDMQLKPYLMARSAKEGGDPAASYALMGVSSIFAGGVIRFFAPLLSRFGKNTKGLSVKQIGKQFDDAMGAAARTGAGRIFDDIVKGCDMAVDSVINNLNPRQRGILDSIAVPGDKNFIEDVLRPKLKETLVMSTKGSKQGKELNQNFNLLVSDLEDILRNSKSLDDLQKRDAAAILNNILVGTYRGANKSIDNALNEAAVISERNAKQAKAVVTKTANRARIDVLKSSGSRAPEITGDAMSSFSELQRFRRSRYELAVRDMLEEFESVDEGFSTYYYLSGAKRNKNFDDVEKLGPTGPGRNAFTQRRAAREEILRKFNSKIKDLNEEVRENLKNIETQSGQRLNVDLKNIEYEEFKDLDAVEDFITDVVDSIFKDALRSVNRAEENLNSAGTERLLGDMRKKSEELRDAAAQKRKDADDELMKLGQPKSTKVADDGESAVTSGGSRFLAKEEIDDALEMVDKLRKEADLFDEQATFEEAVETFLDSVSKDPKTRDVVSKAIDDISQSAKDLRGGLSPAAFRKQFEKVSGKTKLAYLSAIFGGAFLSYKAYRAISSRFYNEDTPLSVGDSPLITLVDDENTYKLILLMLGYNVRDRQQYYPKDGEKFKSTVRGNFQKLARASGLFLKRGAPKGNFISDLIRASAADGDSHEKILQNIKNELVSKSRTRTTRKHITYLQVLIDKSKTKEIGIQMETALDLSLIVFALGSTDFGTLPKILNDRPTGRKLERDSKNAIRLHRTLYKTAEMNIESEFNRLITSDTENQQESKSMKVQGTRKYLSSIVSEVLKEYRQLDNYNQYPYHSDIGSSEEDQRDFIEDWKDFELSLVRDETRDTAIELAKILVKDLELFGDVVDLVGKNQSVGSEILKKIKNKQEKEK